MRASTVKKIVEIIILDWVFLRCGENGTPRVLGTRHLR
jgi:hypothetical protein